MKKLPKINDLVVVNHEPDATMFRVKEIRNSFSVGLIDAEREDKHPNQYVQYVDKSILRYPSVGQLSRFNEYKGGNKHEQARRGAVVDRDPE